MTRRLGMLDVLIGYPPGRRWVDVRPGPGPVAGSSTVGRVHRPAAKGRQRRAVRSGLAWCRQSPNTISLLLSAVRGTVFSFAGYVRVLRGQYHARYRAVAGRADTGEARDNRAGRDAPEPAVEDAEHRLVRAGYSGHDVPTRHGSPGPKLTSIAANDARVRGRGWRPMDR